MSFYIIIRGPLGCGKSTISKELTKILKAKYFSVDDLADKYQALQSKEGEFDLSEENLKKLNKIISKQAKETLQKGKPVIFDGNFYWKSQINDLTKKLKFPHHIFTLKIPLKVCIERDKNRKNSHGKDAVDVVYKKSAEFETGIPIDVTRSLNECVNEILSYLPHNPKY